MSYNIPVYNTNFIVSPLNMVSSYVQPYRVESGCSPLLVRNLNTQMNQILLSDEEHTRFSSILKLDKNKHHRTNLSVRWSDEVNDGSISHCQSPNIDTEQHSHLQSMRINDSEQSNESNKPMKRQRSDEQSNLDNSQATSKNEVSQVKRRRYNRRNSATAAMIMAGIGFSSFGK